MALFSLLFALTGCTVLAPSELASQEDTRGEFRAWEAADAPTLLVDNLEMNYNELPRDGHVDQTPWAGSYWPTYEDSVNVRWDGEDSQSAIEKYAEAFGLDGQELSDRVSAEFGIDSINGETCTDTDDCETGESCSKRLGAEEGTCIETWFGLCHAWAPAAIMQAEPVQPVTYNGVTFKVNDLKALTTMQYHEGLTTKFMSLRCNADSSDEDFALDAYGNPVEQACADTNAGAFHAVITNLIGIQGKTLVEDRTFDYQVWNQPIRSFDVTYQRKVSAKRASELAGGGWVAPYPFNDDAVYFKHVKLTLAYISESATETDGNLNHDIDLYTHEDDYEYVLEMDANWNIIGGEWVGDSKTNHPDFLWLAETKRESELAGVEGERHQGVVYSGVKALLDASTAGSGADNKGFDWGAGCDAGAGDFAVDVAEGQTTSLGTIPAGKVDVQIVLDADADVDVQLLDSATGEHIIAWPEGILGSEAGESCTTLDGAELCYSGYNGDGTNLGNEWIRVTGTLGRDMDMAVFGYQGGAAGVAYSYAATPDCIDSGSGSFSAAIVEGDVVPVGILPAGKTDVSITLNADQDVDIQLFLGNTPLVQWPDGLLNAAGEGSVETDGVTVTWSGYNGVDGDAGHETLTITGALQSDLIMKAFGYNSGTADIQYSWGQ